MKPKEFVHQSTDIQCVMEPTVHCHSLYDAGSDDFQMALLFCDENTPKISHIFWSVVLEQLVVVRSVVCQWTIT